MNKSIFTPTGYRAVAWILLILLSPFFGYTQALVGVSSSPVDGGSQAGPTAVITPPAGMVAGDLVVIYAHYRDGSNGISLSILDNSGQAWVNETQGNSNGGNQTFAIFWCRFNGNWSTPAGPSVTVTTGTEALTATMYVYRPTSVTKSWGIHVSATNSSSNANTNNTISGYNTTVPNTVTMAFWGNALATTWSNLSGASWSQANLSAQYRNLSGNDQSHTAAYNIQSSAGTVAAVSQNQAAKTTTLRSILTWYEFTPPPPPSNDECAEAIGLTLGTSKSGTVWSATNSSISTVCSGTPDDDVWYKFTPTATSATITLSGVGTNLSTSGAMIQVFSGSCGSLNSIACGTTSVTALGLTTGTEYYIRVYSTGNGSIGGTSVGSAFTITVTGPIMPSQTNVGSGRMNEVFRQTILSSSGVLDYPWEVTYGPDNNLWVTESKGYKVYKMDPNTGAKNIVLDISQNSTFFSTPDNSFNCQFSNGSGAQGGLAGLALHPNFLDGTANEKNYVYISYIHSQTNTNYFTNRLVRFIYNSSTNRLESPVSLCDTLPGSNDHNSQRIIIAPVDKGGTNYLFYASGDMGAGQFANRMRSQNAQIPASYEGKILRFNLEPDTDAHPWIPSDNPYSSSSAVYSIGIRNNQGFAYDTALHILYGSSHGPYSDDEINIIEKKRNYGHPLVIGYASDGNYNGNTVQGTSTSVSAGAAFTDNSGISSCPPIGNEATNRTAIDANGNGFYKDPLFSAYAQSQTTVSNIWRTNPGNGTWPSEGWSGLDLYANSMIPGWKQSLVAASLKWGRLVRIRLGSSGTITIPSNSPTNNAGDTISYFGSQNRFRDLAFSPNGKDIFVVMDNTSTTSGPGSANPVVPGCGGCVQKYTFLGYNVNSGSGNRSYIPNSIDIATGKANAFETANKVVINAANGNNNLWVPITDAKSNIVAEIYAQGRNLDTVTTTIYTRTGTSRIASEKKYLNRHLTISPQKQPGGQVLIRLYISKTEYDQLVSDGGVGVIGNLKIIKNEDSATAVISSNTSLVNTTISEAFGSNGYVLQGDVSSFSSFYFASDIIAMPLPLQLLTFKGSLQNDAALLEWETANEINTSHFAVERSVDGISFDPIGTVAAAGHSTAKLKYSYWDLDAMLQSTTKLYYRLKQVDEDGSFSYSKAITIKLNSDYTVSMYPNPITDVLKIRLSLSKAQRVHVHVTDMNGRVVYQSSKVVSENNIEWKINTRAWPAQSYSVRITGSDNKTLTVQNVIKM